MNGLHVQGMKGFGDNIYQRPFIRAAAFHHQRVWLTTPWPELYSDLSTSVFPVKDPTKLRTQALNVQRTSDSTWLVPPDGVPSVRMFYGVPELREGSILDAMEKTLPLGSVPFVMDLPPLPEPLHFRGKYAVIRPVTHRTEWYAPARSPDPVYLRMAAEILRDEGFIIVRVADVDGQNETFHSNPPEADYTFHSGEVASLNLLSLINSASVVVGGSGWIIPACVASKTPLIVIGGGLGAHNAPEKVTCSRMALGKARWILPVNYCMCEQMRHNCDKVIRGFKSKFTNALEEVAR